VQLCDEPYRAEYSVAVIYIGLWQRVELRDAPYRAEGPLAIVCIGLWQKIAAA